MNPLKNKSNQQLKPRDIPLIKHEFIKAYGHDYWETIGLDELFELLPLLFEDRNKREGLRLNTLRYYGIKNPK